MLAPRPALNNPKLLPRLLKVMGAINVWLYRVTGGRLGNNWRIGPALTKPAPICLLTTTGHKSGKLRTSPLVFMADGDRVLLAASMGGMPRHPFWYVNLSAHPDVQVQIGTATRPMRARTADGSERTELWRKMIEVYAGFDDYQSYTEREIPVVILEPR